MSRLKMFSVWRVACLCIALKVSLLSLVGASQPNIITIMADDMGWNDVGFHGSNQIPTPNIDALAYNGVILNRHYTQSTCSPSRTAFLTGKYPIRLGLQGRPLLGGEPRGLPLDVATLPQRLKDLGYVTRLVGKWHLGSFRTEYTPTKRGFDSFLGYWNGHIGYFNHTNHIERMLNSTGLDFRRDLSSTDEFEGKYATEIFTNESLRIIAAHDTSKPLYLNIGHLAVHVGDEDKPLAVPDEKETHDRFQHIESPERRLYAGMVHELDKSVGHVMRALSAKGILNNTIVVFLADNGAPTTGIYNNHGSNWPLRGIKHSLHEGALRNFAAVWSSQLQQPGRASNQLFHLSDWLPTLYTAAGGKISDLGDIDGVDQWASLLSTTSYQNPRSRLLLNIQEEPTGEALIDGKWKISKIDKDVDKFGGFYGDTGFEKLNPLYNTREIVSSLVNIAIAENKAKNKDIAGPTLNFDLDMARIMELRAEATIGLQGIGKREPIDCSKYCLYDIYADPCETVNLASENKMKLDEMIGVLNKYREEMVPESLKPLDPNANPALHGNVWVSWLDEHFQGKCSGSNQCSKTEG